MVTLKKLHEGGFLISKVKQISGRIFDKMLKAYQITDLNTAQGRIVFSLWQNDDIPISQLVKQTALGKTSLTSMLDRLEQVGYVIRKPDEQDKRKIVISLTEKSKLLKENYDAVSHDMNSLFYQGLSEDAIDQFEETLKHILANLNQYEEDNK